MGLNGDEEWLVLVAGRPKKVASKPPIISIQFMHIDIGERYEVV